MYSAPRNTIPSNSRRSRTTSCANRARGLAPAARPGWIVPDVRGAREAVVIYRAFTMSPGMRRPDGEYIAFAQLSDRLVHTMTLVVEVVGDHRLEGNARIDRLLRGWFGDYI